MFLYNAMDSIGKHDRAKIDINHHEFGKPLVESTYRSLSSFHCSLKVTWTLNSWNWVFVFFCSLANAYIRSSKKDNMYCMLSFKYVPQWCSGGLKITRFKDRIGRTQHIGCSQRQCGLPAIISHNRHTQGWFLRSSGSTYPYSTRQ